MDIDTHPLTSFRDFEVRLARERREPRNESPFYNERESTATTATLRGDSMIRESSMDLDIHVDNTQMEEVAPGKRFIVAIDFGTTFSSISFVALPRDTQDDETLNPHSYHDQIQSIINFPEEPRLGLMESRKEVPTEIWYPKQEYLDHSLIDVARNGSESPPTDDTDVHMHDVVDNGDRGVEEEAEDDDDDENKDTYWGYQVQTQLQYPDTNRNQNRRMARFKLLLDESEVTQKIRVDLEPNLKLLKKRKIIKDREDVIADYLKYLFAHAKDELTQNHEFTNDCPVEFVLCVPPIWTPNACRIMQKNMERAIRESGFGSVENDCVDNLFIVSEPEAAAAYVLASTTTVLPNEAFVLLDAGGGTVDAITYTVDQPYPLRLKSEGVEAGGVLCGSSYLNEAFQEHLRTRLEGEDYLESNGMSIRGIIDTQVINFENEIKRKIDVTLPKFRTETIFIHGLKANSDKKFANNRLKMEREDLEGIFLPILEKIDTLMKRQLELAKQKKINVTKVILIGGFANSPSLRSYLRTQLASLRNYREDDIALVFPNSPEPAVASGAVLRALNKRDGPQRFSRSSYGFRCHEEFNPDLIPAHVGVTPYCEPLDGRKYLKNTIDWLINKGDKIPSYEEYSIPVFYIFDADRRTRFECEEVLFVSDEKMESHYRGNHEKNKGAKRVGKIETDMTFLKEQNLIQPVEVEDGVRAKRHYNVKFELVMIVNGRNLRWEARYPAGGEVQGRAQISIASAFVPGTK